MSDRFMAAVEDVYNVLTTQEVYSYYTTITDILALISKNTYHLDEKQVQISQS